ncbi:MAG: helix-turn-helix transcriptional regulator [Pseudomonadota bacterium]
MGPMNDKAGRRMRESDLKDKRIETARQNLRIAIAIREKTAAEVSVAAGLSKNLLGSFIRGQSSISYANLLRICDELNVPIGVLHRPGAVTPGRLELQSTLEQLSPEELEQALRSRVGSD